MLQGRMDEARHLLSKEASADPTSMNMYKILDDLMKKMPVPTVCTKWVFFMQFHWEKRGMTVLVQSVSSLLGSCHIAIRQPVKHLSLSSNSISVLESFERPNHTGRNLLGVKPAQLDR